MTDERYKQLNDPPEGGKLTPEEISQKWHFCAEFDGLLIGPGMGEMASCLCFEKQPEPTCG